MIPVSIIVEAFVPVQSGAGGESPCFGADARAISRGISKNRDRNEPLSPKQLLPVRDYVSRRFVNIWATVCGSRLR